MALDLTKATKENPDTLGVPSVKKVLDPVRNAGYRLALIILSIMAAYILFIIIIFFIQDFDSSSAVQKTTTIDKEIFERLASEKKAYRDFLISISQMILLNLLLPTLTAILGYIFGVREKST